MVSRFWTIFNWGALVVVTLFSAVIIWNSLSGEVVDEFVYEEEEVPCIDVMAGVEYDACYDAYLETIFLKVRRGRDGYNINSFKVSFLDLSKKVYDLDDIPNIGEEKAYKLPAEKNPRDIDLEADVIKDFAEPICDAPEQLFVDYCPVGTSGEGVDVLISPLGGIEINDFIEVEDTSDLDSDIFTIDLVDAGRIWDSLCNPDWECSEWETCVDGVSRRDCEDVKGCAVSKDAPVTVRGCDGDCIEDWECEWGDCKSGVSVPSCVDSNNCGTRHDIPMELSCDKVGKCIPEIECGEWSECEVDYDFVDLIGDGFMNLRGSKSRICVDDEKCTLSQREIKDCSVSVDVYTDDFKKCGEEYVGIYNSLNDEMLAIVKRGMGDNEYLNIYFSKEENIRCDYCFDGVMNGDEEEIDCGGSCQNCDDYERVVYEESFWEWFRGFFS